MASPEAGVHTETSLRVYTHDLPPGTVIYTAPRTQDARCRLTTHGHCHVDIRGSDRHARTLVPARVKDAAKDDPYLYQGRSVWVAQRDLNRLHQERTVPSSSKPTRQEPSHGTNFTPVPPEPPTQGVFEDLAPGSHPDSYFKHGL